MPPNEMSKASASPNAKAKAKDRERRARVPSKQQTERLKTVVRRLPPNLPEDIFWQSVQSWVTEETVVWKAYYQGKLRKRLNKENVASRAYIAFKNEDILAVFSREYDGHLFRDKAGNESIAVVEFAPFQKIPAEKKKADSRMGTIEKDEDYISFLDSLKEGSTKPVDAESLDTLIAASQPPPQPTTTPLLEALKAEKSAQKDKEAILRNHAHYKDQGAVAGPSASSKKEDSKKKGAPSSAQNATQKASEPQVSKKAAKKAAAAAKAAQQQQPVPSAPAAKTTNAPPVQPKQAQQAAVASSKPSRPPRERQQKPSAPPTTAAVPSAPSTAPGTDAASSAQAEPTSAPASVPIRRTRPMLGLASRQFEAALNEAGVERRSRREKGPAPSGDGAAKAKQGDDKRAGGEVLNVAVFSAPSRPTSSGQGQILPSAPTILQREGQQAPKILGRDGAGVSVPTGEVDEGASGGRGGGRPRPRGRGRGGARGG